MEVKDVPEDLIWQHYRSLVRLLKNKNKSKKMVDRVAEIYLPLSKAWLLPARVTKMVILKKKRELLKSPKLDSVQYHINRILSVYSQIKVLQSQIDKTKYFLENTHDIENIDQILEEILKVHQSLPKDRELSESLLTRILNTCEVNQ